MPRPANRWNGAVCDWMDKIREAWKQTANRAHEHERDDSGEIHGRQNGNPGLVVASVWRKMAVPWVLCLMEMIFNGARRSRQPIGERH